MTAERWTQITEIYDAVLACPPAGRGERLFELCGSDTDLLREIESLLEAREQAGNFLSPDDLRDQICEFSEPELAPGCSFGRYQILSVIGVGGMGEVYLALDTELGRQVALKILPHQFTRDEGRVARFRREARAASALNHPNIVTIYDIGRNGETWFIAQEFIEGETLRARVARGSLSTREALDITIQCAGALKAAHDAGIVHQDIKPENIIVRPDGLVKIVDFGLASISQKSAGDAAVGRTAEEGDSADIAGTPRYMSPEQARGDNVDRRTDIFSLGAVLYEMLMGRAAATAGTNAAGVFAGLRSQSNPLPRGATSSPRMNRVLQKALERDREKRYLTIEEFEDDLRKVDPRRSRRRVYAAAAALVLAAGAILFLYVQGRRASPLTDHDTVLLGDFQNQTGDPVFDPTLKEGLAVQLEQSPVLNVLPDARVRETLRLMGRQNEQHITSDIGREICERLGIKAMITGSIAPLGSHYVINLEATDAHNGETLARAQAEARNKEEVLKALSTGAARLRRKLGESLASVQKYDALLERTTSSLEALRAYSLGYEERRRGRMLSAIPFFEKAVELDPKFAYAYSDLATLYLNSRRFGLAAENAVKAYALREPVSEREKLRITSLYYEVVTGEIDKDIETLKIYLNVYPQDPLPHNNLSVAYSVIGQYELSAEESRAAMRLDPDSATRFSTLANALIHLNRYAEAKEVCEKALRQKLDDPAVHHHLYRVAFVSGDRAALEQYQHWFAGKPNEYSAIAREAAGAAYAGEWHLSSDYAQRAIREATQATQSDARELAAFYAADAALRAAALGKCSQARSAAAQSFAIEQNQVSGPRAALARELCGEKTDTQTAELMRRYPKNTVVNSIWLPVLRAQAEMNRGNAAAAIEMLRPTTAYEAAAEFWPQYLRGEAFWRLRKSSESATEFKKILDHRGQAVDSVLYPLAHLGMARAVALGGDAARAREQYQAFLTEWKDADADLTPLLSARRELQELR